MKNQNRILYLLTRKRKYGLDEQEQQELDSWIGEDDSKKMLLKQLENQDKQYEVLQKFQRFASQQSLAEFKKHHINVVHSTSRLSTKTRPLIYWSVAALVLVCSTIALYFMADRHTTNKADELSIAAKNIAPGKDKAILKLSNGDYVILEDIAYGTSKNVNGLKIIKSPDGEISYEPSGNTELSVMVNKIVTPKGGQYRIRLSDGTRVWLGAESELEYPLQFAGSSRQVKLSGEAFFEVTRHKGADDVHVPFQLILPQQTIDVLGTSFNVSAYPNDPINRTTLVKGKVKVTTSHSSITLEPGQQALVVKNDGTLQINQVDVRNMEEWKNRSFRFEEESIQEIMKKIARWYDVEISYEGDVTTELFTGAVSKYENPSKVLKLLELTGKIKFRIEGRRIIVMS